MKFLTFLIATLALSAAAVHADDSADKTAPVPKGATLMKKINHRTKKKPTVEAAKEAPKATTDKGGN
jgi:hypothetical protein